MEELPERTGGSFQSCFFGQKPPKEKQHLLFKREYFVANFFSSKNHFCKKNKIINYFLKKV